MSSCECCGYERRFTGTITIDLDDSEVLGQQGAIFCYRCRNNDCECLGLPNEVISQTPPPISQEVRNRARARARRIQSRT